MKSFGLQLTPDPDVPPAFRPTAHPLPDELGADGLAGDELGEPAGKLGAGHLMMLLSQYGYRSKQTARLNLRCLAADIFPRRPERFNQWEDRWWSSSNLEMAKPAPLASVA